MENSEVDEVAQLRSRILELERELELGSGQGSVDPGSFRSRRGWSITSGVLILLACLLAPLSVTAVWANTQMSDVDRYVQTVAPLAQDPAVQQAVADEVTAAVLQSTQVKDVTEELLGTLAQQPNVPPRVAAALPSLAGPITEGVETFTRRKVEDILSSDEFAKLWSQVNRTAHDQVVRLLAGDPDGVVTAQGDTVTLNLAPIVEQVEQELVSQGFTLAANVPDVERSFVLAQSRSITKAQSAYRLLDALGTWLPLVVVGHFAVGILVASDRRRALLRAALGLVAAMLLVGIALAVFRTTYVQSTPADMLSPAAAGDVFDTLVTFLRTGIRAVAVLGLVTALIAYLSGPSSTATRTRAVLVHGVDGLRDSAESAGWHAGRAGAWTFEHKRAVRTVVLVTAGFTLLFWPSPTALVVVGTAVVVALVLLVVEFLAKAAQPIEVPVSSTAG